MLQTVPVRQGGGWQNWSATSQQESCVHSLLLFYIPRRPGRRGRPPCALYCTRTATTNARSASAARWCGGCRADLRRHAPRLRPRPASDRPWRRIPVRVPRFCVPSGRSQKCIKPSFTASRVALLSNAREQPPHAQARVMIYHLALARRAPTWPRSRGALAP